MRQVSILEYYWFGTCVRYLHDAQEGFRVHNDERGGWFVLSNLQRYLEYLVSLDLHVTRRASATLREQMGELKTTHDDATLTSDQAKRLAAEMTKVRHTLEAEIEGSTAYVLSPMRMETSRLMHSVQDLLAPGVFPSLPSIAQYDLAEAGKCTALELPTAAAFHLIRATEASLRAFYLRMSKRGRVQLMWGPMLQDLRKRKAAKPHGVLLDHLDNIRRSFRNPTQHPEHIYDVQQVQDLWGVCIDAINRMAVVLKAPGSSAA